MSRPNDICFIGSGTSYRANVMIGFMRRDFMVECRFTVDRIEHEEWIERHRRAKLFVSGDGGGHLNDRPHQLLTIAPMINFNVDQLLPFPWVDGLHCITVGDQDGVLSQEDVLKVQSVLEDSDGLYSIYRNGVEHLHRHHSDEARAEYVLEQMASVGLE